MLIHTDSVLDFICVLLLVFFFRRFDFVSFFPSQGPHNALRIFSKVKIRRKRKKERNAWVFTFENCTYLILKHSLYFCQLLPEKRRLFRLFLCSLWLCDLLVRPFLIFFQNPTMKPLMKVKVEMEICWHEVRICECMLYNPNTFFFWKIHLCIILIVAGEITWIQY